MTRCKRGIALGAVLLSSLLWLGQATADDVWPPDWRGNLYSTQQNWEFTLPGGPWAPDFVNNPCGPVSDIWGGNTWHNFVLGRQGVVELTDGGYMQIEWIADCDLPQLQKYIWIQTTVYGFLPPMRFELIANDQYFSFENPPLMGVIEHPDGWITVVHRLTLPFCPDGEWLEIWFTSTAQEFVDQIVIDTICLSEGPGKICDINGDGIVNLADLALFAQDYLVGPYNPRSDLNGDGILDLRDVVIFADCYLNP